jgi:peptidoglycan pentaglycine glycine transferase (the first glycine)
VTYNLIMKLIEEADAESWDRFVNSSPNGHPLQLWGWGEVKRENGWRPFRLISEDGTAGAQVLLWPIPRTRRYVAYIPRGPICHAEANAYLLEALVAWATNQRALYLRIEPAWKKATMPTGWILAKDSIQMAATATLDLSKNEDDLLANMERKHRQYINKSEREGVTVRQSGNNEFDSMWRIYVETADRAGFGLHSRHYYELLALDLGANSRLYYASIDGRDEAFLWLATGGRTAYELYGGVTASGQQARANYHLKWSVIRAMKNEGFLVYDFNGRLNEGVSRFKEGFGPDETNWIGTWDYPIENMSYALWTALWPLAKPAGRFVRKLRGR